MIKIQTQPNLNEVSAFIASLNRHPENHIGFCGKQQAEILHELEEDFTDVLAKDAFVMATEQDKIVGVCGFDADLERRDAEIWGPFVGNTNALQASKLLWQELVKIIPDVIHTVELFPNDNNKTVFDFALQSGFDFHSEQKVLTCTRYSLRGINDNTAIQIPKHHYNTLIKLHDKIFPKTYLSGREMVKELDKEFTVFGVIDKNENLLGYLYAEAYPKFADGSIEFVGVDPSARGKGVGSALLVKALQWLFSFQSIEEISLCVRSDSSNAIHLYKKVGFHVEYELTSFEKKLGCK